MILVFDPVSNVLLVCMLVELLRERARRPDRETTPEEKASLPQTPITQQSPIVQQVPPVAAPIAAYREVDTVEIVRILPEGGYSRTGMVRQAGHPDIAEALTHESLAILRSDGNIEVTPGEMEVAPNVR